MFGKGVAQVRLHMGSKHVELIDFTPYTGKPMVRSVTLQRLPHCSILAPHRPAGKKRLKAAPVLDIMQNEYQSKLPTTDDDGAVLPEPQPHYVGVRETLLAALALEAPHGKSNHVLSAANGGSLCVMSAFCERELSLSLLETTTHAT